MSDFRLDMIVFIYSQTKTNYCAQSLILIIYYLTIKSQILLIDHHF